MPTILMTNQIAPAERITEELREQDQMVWVGAMENIRSAVVKIALHEIVHA